MNNDFTSKVVDWTKNITQKKQYETFIQKAYIIKKKSLSKRKPKYLIPFTYSLHSL